MHGALVAHTANIPSNQSEGNALIPRYVVISLATYRTWASVQHLRSLTVLESTM
jgi:hypothetical protein